ncbi:alpha/beta hydrolase [Gilvimarinus japonicus]|uniref:Alpha/beta hydrolase n=1 Tax=Gilvimarinus japonicus TaxID=1796469 RepID=A0ABV7HM27_9GAMM
MTSDLFESDRVLLLAGPVGALEVSVSLASAAKAVMPANAVAIVCHPHPLHGGTMDNKVVTTLMRTYRDLGAAVVRFNFRGVGASEGEYAEGVGEVDDLLAVIAEVQRHRPGAPLYLAGFSFGAAAVAKACATVTPVRHVALVAPPVPRYQLADIKGVKAPLAVLQGAMDERVVAAEVARWVAALEGDVSYREFAAAGHFFHGELGPLKQTLTEIVAGLEDE